MQTSRRLPINDVSIMSDHSASTSSFRNRLNTSVSSDFYFKEEKIAIRRFSSSF